MNIQVLTFLLPSVVSLALFVVGVVLSRGVARILLAAWVAIQAVSVAVTLLAPNLVDALGIAGWGVLNALITFGGSLLLGVALIVGRPGYRGEDAPVPTGYPGYPQAPTGPQGPAGPFS